MALPMTFTPQEAAAYAAEGCLEEWVHLFLKTAGGNLPFSDGLKLQKRYWAGPVLLPLGELERCCGPEPEMEFRSPPDSWDAHVAELEALLREGWAYPPLIAQAADGKLSIRDGNHRHEALRRTGASSCWTIVWGSESREELAPWAGRGLDEAAGQ
ncbi:ParB N-terminal domain-containing protein [Paenibacillus sp. MWE-103]|uniref:ParB N-terminal domain-containing protein n=1 Tax=Paenibacillus artemisiicola TaxID=1172618 RepID=A0ABS3W8D2_9BACL|nr:ParB N-terminal domain-containing protein [Paenibacillus artemisiicola]MBO7744576.1 ParB N-terminal domain-containing protein [Paenibacillus artemisiicola]